MKSTTAHLAQARRDLPEVLQRAAIHLVVQGNFEFLNDEPDIFTTDELATLIQQASERLARGDESDGRRLWGIFAPTRTWDDAHGDSQLGQEVFELIDSLFRPE